MLRIHQNSPNWTKLFKDFTNQRPDDIVLCGIWKHGYRAQYGGESSGGRDQGCGLFGDCW